MPHDSANTEHANTDFDLKSNEPFHNLHNALQKSCCALHYKQGDDGKWYGSYEAEEAIQCDAATSILAILKVLASLPRPARNDLDACLVREFNIGFHSGDTWGYVEAIPPAVVRSVADLSCSIAVTLYPMRNADGTLKT